MKKKEVIALWQEDGDLERMKLFFQKNNPNLEQKERIKQLALKRIQEEEEKSPRKDFISPEIQAFEGKRDGFQQQISRIFKSLRWNQPWKIALPLVVVIFLVWAGKDGFQSNFGYFGQKKSITAEVMTASVKPSDLMDPAVAGSAPTSSAADSFYSLAEGGLPSGAEEQKAERNSGNANQKAAGTAAPSPLSDDLKRKITYNIHLSLQVEDVSQTMDRITQDVKKIGGYVAESYQDSFNANDNARITLKVPADQLEEYQASLSGLGKMLNQQTTANDITSQYYDAETRLRNWEAQEQRYLDLFKEAKTLDDILKVENALSNIRSQIEQLKGQLKLWDHEVDYSTIQLNLQTNSQPVNIEDPWEPMSWTKTWQVAKAATLKTISSLWNALNYLVIGVAYGLPYLGLGLIIYGFYRFLRSRRHK